MPCEGAAVELPRMTLLVGKPKPGSPIKTVEAPTKTPGPKLPVIVLPPGRSARERKTETPKRPKAPAGFVALPEIVLPTSTPTEPIVTWMPLEPLSLIVFGAAAN